MLNALCFSDRQFSHVLPALPLIPTVGTTNDGKDLHRDIHKFQDTVCVIWANMKKKITWNLQSCHYIQEYLTHLALSKISIAAFVKHAGIIQIPRRVYHSIATMPLVPSLSIPLKICPVFSTTGRGSWGDLCVALMGKMTKLRRKFSHKRMVSMHAEPRPLRTLIFVSSILTVERSFSHRVPSPAT